MHTHRPWIRSQRVAVVLGLLLFVGAVAVLYDAYDGRGKRPPFLLRFLSPA